MVSFDDITSFVCFGAYLILFIWYPSLNVLFLKVFKCCCLGSPLPGFELVSPCPYPATITITPRAPPIVLMLMMMSILCCYRKSLNVNMKLFCSKGL